MKYVLPLLILINIHEIIGVLEWTVTGKVTDFGQNVTLFCHVPNCCPKDSGWDRWTPNQRTLFIDVKTGRSNKKYDGRVMKDGYTLVIQNLTKQDLNVSYSCLYGVTLGEQKLLLKEDVFANKSTGQTNVQPGIYEGHIAGIIAVVGVIVAVVVVVSGFHFWRRRKNRKFQFKVENECRTTESVPLMVKGGSSIECREGDDAVFTYTSQTENLSVNLSKGGNETIEKEHANGQYKFLLKNMQKHNSGEYDLQVRTFFRKKFHLNIKELFLEGPSNLECTEGEEAIFTCKVLPDSPSVILRTDDIDITNKCDMLTEECGDKHVIYTLKLKNTNSSDSGEYSLQVGKTVRKVQLKINEYFLEDPSNLEYTEGQDAIFNCKVLSDSPSVVLLKDDIDITNKCDMLTEECGDKNVIYTLTLKNTNSSDSGEYSLQVGKSVRKVQLKINVYFLEDPSDLECTEGEEAIFISKVIPGSPSIVLRIEDKDITNRCEMSKEDCGDTHVIYKLKLKKTQRSDNREYRLQCGKSFRKVHLKINGYFLDDPSDVEVIEGKEAILTCKVRQGSTPVKWLKDGIEIMQNENCVMYDVATEQERKLQLVLNNTKRNDNGEYIVEIGQFSRKLHLEIKSYFLQDPSNVMVIEGEEAILKCRVRQESTSIKWLKAGVEIIQNENCILSNVETQHELHLQLLLKKTKQKNSGEYTVQIGKFSRKLQLKIKTYFLEDPSDTKCIEGEDAIFKCKVCSDSPSVQLLKDGIDITERTNYERTREGQLHELKLVNTSTSDGGDYFVHIGKSHRKVSLIVKEKPSIDEKKSYMEAIKAGTEIRKYVRIQVMGKGRAGKTSLVRRLLHRDINGVESTDGIEIERTCSIKESDGEWRFNTFSRKLRKEYLMYSVAMNVVLGVLQLAPRQKSVLVQ